LSGSQEDISALHVRINQVEIACPSGVVTAYVSVTDQVGYPVTGLIKDDFLIKETGGYAGPPKDANYVENNAALSVALAMDYSRSVTLDPDKVSDMKEAAVSFVNQLGIEDEAEFITFTSEPTIVQPFTSDHNLLLSAIDTPWDTRFLGTAIYDAGIKAVEETELRSKDRKAVVLMTDGKDTQSKEGVDDLIEYALLKNVPLFPVGLGDNVNDVDLKKLADSTGGQYYAASKSDNLRNVYQQLADVLLSYQYILTYNTGLANATTADLTVEATLPSTTITGRNTRSISSCP
jgi:Ca-activated chloride channel family protein